jgi:hypothetical protein
MFECINVLIMWVSKWYKSADNNRHRRFGFIVSTFVSGSWIYYFCHRSQYWLAANSIFTIYIAIRGMRNNRKETNDQSRTN